MLWVFLVCCTLLRGFISLTNTFVLCIPCNVVILIKLIIQAIKFNFYFIAMVNNFGQSGDPRWLDYLKD